jgi:hypothetical protein
MRKRTKDGYKTLLAVLEREAGQLRKVAERNKQAADRLEAGAREWMDYVVVAHTLHNLYCIMESYCLRIAKFFENEIGEESWHRDLLQRMTLDIEGLRPALFLREEADAIDELRGFRHLYRNLYDKDIEPGKIDALQTRLPGLLSMYFAAHGRFTRFLEETEGAIDV